MSSPHSIFFRDHATSVEKSLYFGLDRRLSFTIPSAQKTTLARPRGTFSWGADRSRVFRAPAAHLGAWLVRGRSGRSAGFLVALTRTRTKVYRVGR
jgi:hypothetical protein